MSAAVEGFLARVARGLGYIATGRPGDWFGPSAPMAPVAPADVAGRQFDYPVAFNLAQGPRAYEPVGFAELRALADVYDLVRVIIETRKDQMERLRWQIRPRERNAAPNDPRIAEIAAFFQRPDRVHGWSGWLRMLLEDLLVIDAPALYLRRTRGGRLYALEPLDGATVKRVIDDFGRTPAPPAPAYQQVLKGMPAVNYTADELLYRPRNLRVHKVYGFSPVEQIQMTVNIALRRQLYQLQYYTEGNIPEALIGVPENWNPDQIRQFQVYWDSLHEGNSAERRHAKFVPGGVARTFIPTREPVLKDVFDEWLARVCCFAFSISPQPFVAQVNRATAESAHDAALEEGLMPLQNWVKDLVDGVIVAEFGAPDLEFAWADDRDSDPEKAAAIAVQYVKAGIKTVNEVRAELGLGPVVGGDGAAEPMPPVPKDENERMEAYAGPREFQKSPIWSANQHPRWPCGAEDGQGGQFRPVSDRMTDAGADAAASDGPVGEPLPPSETPYVAKDYRRFTAPVGNGQCAVLVEKATGAPLAKYWKQGASIADRPNVPDGTAIATFVGGVYPNKSTGNHAAIFVGYGVKNKKPGIWIYDQFVKDGTARIGARFIGFKHGTGYISNDASRFSVIK